jgi:hypothetical protein
MTEKWLSSVVFAACLVVPGVAAAQQDPSRTAPGDRTTAERMNDRSVNDARKDARDAAESRAEMRTSTAAGSGWQAKELIGLSLKGQNRERIGEIHDLVVDDQGQVKAALVDVGGFLGMGEKTVAIDWRQIRIDLADKSAMVGMTKDQLTQLPKWTSDRQQATVESNRAPRTTVPAVGGAGTAPAAVAPR